MLPELADFADDAFLANHCFWYAGVDTTVGKTSVLVAFAPADKIREPDISGLIYLDSATLQIRHAQFHLTKPSADLLRTVSSVTVESRYSEVAPGIPIMSSYSSTTGLSAASRSMGWSASMMTEQLLDVQWLKRKP